MFEFINAAIVVKSVFGKLDFRILLSMFSLSPEIVYVSALQLIKDDRRSFDLHLSAPAPDAIDIDALSPVNWGKPHYEIGYHFLFLEQTLDINIAQNHKSSNVDTKSKRASENKATAACGVKLQKGVAGNRIRHRPKRAKGERERERPRATRLGRTEMEKLKPNQIVTETESCSASCPVAAPPFL